MSNSMVVAEVGRNACRQMAELVLLEDYDSDDSIDDSIEEINNNAKLLRNERDDLISNPERADNRAPAEKFQFDENRKSFAAFDTLVGFYSITFLLIM